MRSFTLLLLAALIIPAPAFSQSVGASKRTQRPATGQKKYLSIKEGEEISAAYRDAVVGFQKEDYRAAAESLKRAYAINPEDDLTINFIAESYAMAGDKTASLEWLRKLLAFNPCFFHLPENATSILNSKEYRQLAKAAEAKRPRAHRSKVAFTLAEKDLIPEGIAYDPVDGAFFLSSLHKRKIVRVKPGARGKLPIVEDFTSEAQDGLYSTLGMKVDAGRRILWVCSSAEAFMKGYAESDAGRAALFKYDLVTRKLVRKYQLGPTPHHLLNDLALNSQGDVFVTDIASGEIFTLAHDKDELEVFIPAGRFDSPNGIAISGDGQRLYISDMPLGVYVLDVKTKHSQRLTQPVGISPSGSDGLYFYHNSLLGILNIVSDRASRVARFHLNPSGDGLTRAEVVDCDHPLYQWPTTGVIVGDSLYYIANSQFGSFDGDRATFPPDRLRKVVILKIKL
jgi:sugar lactone lactonase YvrE